MDGTEEFAFFSGDIDDGLRGRRECEGRCG